VYFVQLSDFVYDSPYRDKKVVGVFVRFSCAASAAVCWHLMMYRNIRITADGREAGHKRFQRTRETVKNPSNNSYYDPDLKMHIPRRYARWSSGRRPEDSFVGVLVSAISARFVVLAQLVHGSVL
jgi:hypothetical protein